MSDHAHGVLVFYGGVLGLILIILCMWCIMRYNSLYVQEADVLPVDDPAEDSSYIAVYDSISPMNTNRIESK